MDVICGRKTVGRTSGQLLANGRPIVKASWSRVVREVYCQQQGFQALNSCCCVCMMLNAFRHTHRVSSDKPFYVFATAAAVCALLVPHAARLKANAPLLLCPGT